MEGLKQILPRHGGTDHMDMDGMNMGQSNSTSAEMMSTFFTTSFVCVSLFPAFLPSPS